MKNIVTAILALLLGCAAFAAVPTRTVLYTCPPGFEFDCFEYYSNMKAVGNKFVCMTYNKQTKEQSLIFNGQPLVTAKNLGVGWVDYDDRNKCIYYYGKDGDWNLVIDGERFGPYEDFYYNMIGAPYYYDGSPNLNHACARKNFKFKRMGQIFYHDNDGSIYPCDGEYLWNAKPIGPVYTSLNGLHKASFSDDYRLLTLDGRPYVIPIGVDVPVDKITINQVNVTDRGKCYLRMEYISNNTCEYRTWVIGDGTMESVNRREEYFDPFTGSIRQLSQSEHKREAEQFASSFNWKNDVMVPGLEISLQDKSRRHFFTANWQYDYVMIDDKQYGKTAPFDAFYDEEANAFAWVCVEGRQLVLYSLAL
jgi:lipoprotein